MPKVLKFLSGLFTTALILLVIVAAGLAVASNADHIKSKIPLLNKYMVAEVISGSMEPAVHVGDVIIIDRTVKPTDIKLDDIITFRSADSDKIKITHRVRGILTVAGQPSFQTKGDANPTADPNFVAADHLIGRMIFRVPYFGYLANFIKQPLGMAIFVFAPAALLVISEIMKMLRAISQEESAKAAQKAAQESSDKN